MPRKALEDLQLARLNELLQVALRSNPLYREKLAGVKLPLPSLDAFGKLPFTSKEELAVTGSDPVNLTWPRDKYVRYHETSGTRGKPLAVYDTADDWEWWIDCWQFVLDAAEVTERDRAVLTFSFGPFIGFWSARDALAARGTLVIPGGGMSSLARLDLIRRTSATVLLCTPTYAIHLADAAQEHRLALAENSIQKIIVAGEPGGSVASVRRRIESAWGADVIDHSGASEVGPWGYGDEQGRGLHVLESQFIAEFLSVEHGTPAQGGELAHLILTPLGRYGQPVIRYRTGDLVRPTWPEGERNRFVLLRGGVLGRADDMMIVRGVNIFPSSIEQILRSFPEVVEYRMTVCKRGEMDEVVVEVEDRLGDPQRIAAELNLKLGLKVTVKQVELMTLPRFEGKAKRFIDKRSVPKESQP
jgi:phenylacetate-CoA ligase